MFLQKQILEFLGYASRRVCLFLILFVLFFTGAFSYTRVGTVDHVYAATSDNLNFQARLLNASGSTVSDGYYNIQFKLYDNATAGTNLWTETYYDSNGVTAGNDNRVRVVNGYFSVNLGSQTSFPAIDWEQNIWLTMNVGGSAQTATPTYDGEMTPRVKLTAVPYALQAKKSETLGKTTAGGGVGTVDFASLTANRLYLLPDSPLATTASPGTICIFNGSSSNCPAATGSANYIQNATASQTLQVNSNFHIQASDDGANNGSVGGIISAAADGQTVDLFQLRASNGSTVLTHFDATGRLAIATSAAPTSVLTVGTNTTTATGGITFGTDTNLYRSTTNTLKTDSNLIVGTIGTGGTNLLCYDGTNKLSTCSSAPGAGSYIHNSTALQTTANFNIQSAAAGSVGGIIRGATSQTADLLQLQNSGGTPVTRFDSAGAITAPSLSATNGTNGIFVGTTGAVNDIYTLGTQTALRFQAFSAGTSQFFNGIQINGVNGALASSAGNGTNAALVLNIDSTGAKGGNTSGTTGQVGGAGGSSQIYAGAGGDAPAGSTNGSGGYILLQGGAPGSGAGVAGSYGNLFLQPNAGRVGIGTVSPGAKLEVFGGNILVNQGNLDTKNSVGNVTASLGGYDGTLFLTNAAGSTKVNISSVADSYFTGGNLGVGIALPTSLLHLGSDLGTSASGIKLGSAGDTNLYRSTTNTLKTDSNLIVGTIGTGGTNLLCYDGTNKLSTCSSAPGAGVYLAKNSADTSSVAVTATNYLYSFTNSSSAIASGVLNLNNGTNTSNTLRVTTAGNPTAGNALIFASNTNASPSGNLLDLQSGSSPTSKFSVSATGATDIAGLLTGQAGLTITGAGSSLSGGIINLNASSNFATNINTGNSTGAVSIGNSLAGAISLQSASTVSITSGTTLSLTSTGSNSINITPGGGTNTGVVVKPTTNSTVAFQIQNAAGTSNLFIADTTNNRIGIGIAPTTTSRLQVSGNIELVNNNDALSFGANASTSFNGTDLVTTLNNASSRLLISGSSPGIGTLSVVNFNNTNVNAGSGTGFLFSTGAATNFIGGFVAQGVTTGNSRVALRVISNGTLSGTDATSPFYIEGSASNGITAYFGARNVLVKNDQNTTAALQVQNAAGTNIFNVDTTNSKVGTADSTSVSTQALTIKSGNASVGSNLSSGAVVIDSGTATGTGTAGNLSIGTGNYVHDTTIGNTATGTSTLTLQAGTTGTIALNTGGTGRAIFDNSNNLSVGNANSSGLAASPNAFTIRGTGNSTANGTGGSLTIQGGAGTSGNANGGNLLLDGGAKAGTGTVGHIVLQGSNAGRVGIGTVSPGAKLEVFGGNILVNQGNLDTKNSVGNVTASLGGYDGTLFLTNAAGSTKVNISSVADSYFTGGNLGVGIALPTSLLHLGSDLGTSASGIKLGSAGDTNLYRSTTNTLKTDSNLIVGTIGTGGTNLLCYDGTNKLSTCSSAPGAGSYIHNSTALQTTANFNIRSAAAGSVGGISIRGATSQTADLLQLQNSGGTPVTRFDSAGAITAPSLSATNGTNGIFVGTTGAVNDIYTLGTQTALRFQAFSAGTSQFFNGIQINGVNGALASSAGNGTNAALVLNIDSTGAKGGNTSGTTGQVGGAGGLH